MQNPGIKYLGIIYQMYTQILPAKVSEYVVLPDDFLNVSVIMQIVLIRAIFWWWVISTEGLFQQAVVDGVKTIELCFSVKDHFSFHGN